MRQVSVYSVSRKRVLWPVCDFADRSLERAAGIMFRPRIERPLAIPFPSSGRKRNSIHSLGCPVFDAIFVNDEGKVVDIRPKIPPHQPLIIPAKACSLVIEVPPGESSKVRLGEKLVLR